MFQKNFNFQGFYIFYIIFWLFLGWKNFTPSKLGGIGLQKKQNGESFFGEKHEKIAHGLNFAPKFILSLHIFIMLLCTLMIYIMYSLFLEECIQENGIPGLPFLMVWVGEHS